MVFVPSRQRTARPARKPGVVLAVGQRAFVNAPSDAASVILLTYEDGIPSESTLRDGTEVEIVGWRPRGSTGTRYRVCDRDSGSDGWLEANELRTSSTRPTADPAALPDVAESHGRMR